MVVQKGKELEDSIEAKKLVACMPAYNEERTIAKVVLLAEKYCDEVLVYDDGSRDMTSEVAQKL